MPKARYHVKKNIYSDITYSRCDQRDHSLKETVARDFFFGLIMWISFIRNLDFEAKRISIFFTFAKFEFFYESCCRLQCRFEKMLEDSKINGVIR
jgi:hypothetical protein